LTAESDSGVSTSTSAASPVSGNGALTDVDTPEALKAVKAELEGT
jgi:hypothetical protein